MDFVDLFAWIQTVTPDQLPDTIQLESAVTVFDKVKWLSKIQEDSQDREKAARARYGSLQRDLRLVYELVGGGMRDAMLKVRIRPDIDGGQGVQWFQEPDEKPICGNCFLEDHKKIKLRVTDLEQGLNDARIYQRKRANSLCQEIRSMRPVVDAAVKLGKTWPASCAEHQRIIDRLVSCVANAAVTYSEQQAAEKEST